MNIYPSFPRRRESSNKTFREADKAVMLPRCAGMTVSRRGIRDTVCSELSWPDFRLKGATASHQLSWTMCEAEQ